MSKELIELQAKLAKEAIEMQDACNMYALIQGYARAATTVYQELKPPGTMAFRAHPVIRMWTAKLATLAGYHCVDGDTFYINAWDDCQKLVEQKAEMDRMASALDPPTPAD